MHLLSVVVFLCAQDAQLNEESEAKAHYVGRPPLQHRMSLDSAKFIPSASSSGGKGKREHRHRQYRRLNVNDRLPLGFVVVGGGGGTHGGDEDNTNTTHRSISGDSPSTSSSSSSAVAFLVSSCTPPLPLPFPRRRINPNHYTRGGDVVLRGHGRFVHVGSREVANRFKRGKEENQTEQYDNNNIKLDGAFVPFFGGGPVEHMLIDHVGDYKLSQSDAEAKADDQRPPSSSSLSLSQFESRRGIFHFSRTPIGNRCSVDPSDPTRVVSVIPFFSNLRSNLRRPLLHQIVFRGLNATAHVTSLSDTILVTNLGVGTVLDAMMKDKRDNGGGGGGGEMTMAGESGHEDGDDDDDMVDKTIMRFASDDDRKMLVAIRQRKMTERRRSQKRKMGKQQEADRGSEKQEGQKTANDRKKRSSYRQLSPSSFNHYHHHHRYAQLYDNPFGELVIIDTSSNVNKDHFINGEAESHVTNSKGFYDVVRFSEEDIYLTRDQFSLFCAMLPFTESRNLYLNFVRFEADVRDRDITNNYDVLRAFIPHYNHHSNNNNDNKNGDDGDVVDRGGVMFPDMALSGGFPSEWQWRGPHEEVVLSLLKPRAAAEVAVDGGDGNNKRQFIVIHGDGTSNRTNTETFESKKKTMEGVWDISGGGVANGLFDVYNVTVVPEGTCNRPPYFNPDDYPIIHNDLNNTTDRQAKTNNLIRSPIQNIADVHPLFHDNSRGVRGGIKDGGFFNLSGCYSIGKLMARSGGGMLYSSMYLVPDHRLDFFFSYDANRKPMYIQRERDGGDREAIAFFSSPLMTFGRGIVLMEEYPHSGSVYFRTKKQDPQSPSAASVTVTVDNNNSHSSQQSFPNADPSNGNSSQHQTTNHQQAATTTPLENLPQRRRRYSISRLVSVLHGGTLTYKKQCSGWKSQTGELRRSVCFTMCSRWRLWFKKMNLFWKSIESPLHFICLRCFVISFTTRHPFVFEQNKAFSEFDINRHSQERSIKNEF